MITMKQTTCQVCGAEGEMGGCDNPQCGGKAFHCRTRECHAAHTATHDPDWKPTAAQRRTEDLMIAIRLGR